MNLKKGTILVFLILILLTVTVLFIFGGNNMYSKNFSELIKPKNIHDLSLTIYYVNPFELTPVALSVDDLLNNSRDVQKVDITGNKLKENIDLLNQINNVDLIPVDHKTYVDARIYYVFKNRINCKVFDVCMWGADNSLFVNGVEVESNDVFYDILLPFLPEDIAQQMEW